MILQGLNQNAGIGQQHKVLIEELEIHILALSSSPSAPSCFIQ